MTTSFGVVGGANAGRVIFVNRFFFPDHSATSQMLTDLVFALAREGFDVQVITSRLTYEDTSLLLPARETIENVRIRRVRTTRFGRHSLPGRAIDYLSFYVAAFFRALAGLRRGDVVVAMTDPPMISVAMMVATTLRGARLVNWLHDLFPEIASVAGIGLARGPAGAILRSLRNLSLKRAAANVAIGERMRRRLLDANVPRSRVHVIPNWANGRNVVPIAHSNNPLRKRWGLRDCFVVGYSGNMGFAAEFGAVLDAAERLQDEARVRFLFIGAGKQRPALETAVRARGLVNVLFQPYQPRDQLRYSLSVADVHLVTLNPALEGLIVPSKYYGITAAGRPAIFIGARNGELADYLAEGGNGMQVDSGDADGLVAAIRHLMDDADQASADTADTRTPMGAAARDQFDRRFSMERAVQRWIEVLGIVNGWQAAERDAAPDDAHGVIPSAKATGYSRSADPAATRKA